MIGHADGSVFWKNDSHVGSAEGLADTSTPPALNAFTTLDVLLGVYRLVEQSGS